MPSEPNTFGDTRNRMLRAGEPKVEQGEFVPRLRNWAIQGAKLRLASVLSKAKLRDARRARGADQA